MAKNNRDLNTPEAGEQVPARRYDSGSEANETFDGGATPRRRRYACWRRSR